MEIKQFWETVTVGKCSKYIRHLRKIIQKVIELKVQLLDTEFFLCITLKVYVYCLFIVDSCLKHKGILPINTAKMSYKNSNSLC